MRKLLERRVCERMRGDVERNMCFVCGVLQWAVPQRMRGDVERIVHSVCLLWKRAVLEWVWGDVGWILRFLHRVQRRAGANGLSLHRRVG